MINMNTNRNIFIIIIFFILALFVIISIITKKQGHKKEKCSNDLLPKEDMESIEYLNKELGTV
jgi:L-asparagine transporter-like permease